MDEYASNKLRIVSGQDHEFKGYFNTLRESQKYSQATNVCQNEKSINFNLRSVFRGITLLGHILCTDMASV